MCGRSLVLSAAGLLAPVVVLTGPAVAAEARPGEQYRRPKPADPFDLVLRAAKTTSQPSSAPAEDVDLPPNPFGPELTNREDALPGVLTVSDGRAFPGHIYTTRAKPLRLYDRDSNLFRDIPLDVIQSIEVHVEWQRMEDDWRWKEQGSDVKVFTGRKYPARKTYYTVTLINDIKLTGDAAQPIYVRRGDETTRFMLHKRQKGKLDTTLRDLPYVKRIAFSEREMLRAMELPPSKRAPSGSDEARKRQTPPRRPPTRR